jgi:hypothetical protein
MVATAAWVLPAQASTAKHPPYNVKPPKPYPIKCTAQDVGFRASGTLISATLNHASGRTFNGTIAVNVMRANHQAPTGSQTYPLSNARVYFHHGGSRTAPAPGSRVQLTGTITELRDHCQMAGFTPTITIRKVDLRRPKH